MSRCIDLSCDLGEAVTEADREVEREIWSLISSANIACDGHTGDEETMARSVAFATRHHVSIGAHPSYPDRENFGRRSMEIEDGALVESLVAQVSTLSKTASAAGAELRHVKPHGALYNDAFSNARLARIICEAVQRVPGGPAIVCGPHSELLREAESHGLRVILEGFGDRRYRRDGSLMPRGSSDALLLDFATAADQALRIATRGEAVASDGGIVEVGAQTICIHSDMEGAPARLGAIRKALENAGFEISAAVKVK